MSGLIFLLWLGDMKTESFIKGALSELGLEEHSRISTYRDGKTKNVPGGKIINLKVRKEVPTWFEFVTGTHQRCRPELLCHWFAGFSLPCSLSEVF